MSAGLALYWGATALLSPFARLFLEARARRGKEDLSRIGERVGRTQMRRPPGPLVWLHGASIGEGLALLPLIAHLHARGFVVLLSTGTWSSAKVLGSRLPPGVLHQFAPLDLPGAVRTFLDHWRPLALLLAESELWPNMIRGCAARAIPVALVNGRMSERSFARWRRAPRMARAIFDMLALCAAQSEDHARRFAGLGARNLIVVGNLKYDGAPPPSDALTLARLRALVGSRPVLVAASTHDGEEAIVLAAHSALVRRYPDLLTILAPRDVSRGPEIAALVAAAGMTCSVRSRDVTQGAAPGSDAQVYVADTVGEMGLWLRLASVAVIGKTFSAGGGQTPVEAVRCGAVVLHGPSVYQFAEAFAALDRAGGALEVSEATLSETIAMLLGDPAMSRAMTRAASKTLDALAGATTRTLAALEPLLSRTAAVQTS